jgi:hypothetical protein
MNPGELAGVRADIFANPLHLDDPQCLPDLLKKAVDTLSAIATGEATPDVAADVLRDMAFRAQSGIPFGEPDSWPYETTLDELERTDR